HRWPHRTFAAAGSADRAGVRHHDTVALKSVPQNSFAANSKPPWQEPGGFFMRYLLPLRISKTKPTRNVMAQPIWLFDLDNTLHDASHAIFPAINENMNGYIAKVLKEAGLEDTSEAANAVRILYWQRYGATLLGMVKHHQISADEF